MRYDATGGQYIYNLSTKRSVFAAGGGALDLGGYTLSVRGTGSRVSRSRSTSSSNERQQADTGARHVRAPGRCRAAVD